MELGDGFRYTTAPGSTRKMNTELMGEALSLFGSRRLTGKINARLDLALAAGIETGHLTRTSSGLLINCL